MALPHDRRKADLEYSNRERTSAGKAPYAPTVARDVVHVRGAPDEVWRTVECPFCQMYHVHVGRRPGTRITAPCEPRASYVLVD